MMDLIAAHRRALADALSQLSADQWRGRSLCAGWTPVHVLAHQTMPFRISEPDFMAGLAQCGGDFTKFSDQIAERDSNIPPAELVAVLRENADNPWAPPGGGLAGALSHDVIHGLDISWPFRLDYEIPDAAMTAVLESLTGSLAPAADSGTAAGAATLFGFPLAGIEVVATDLGWSAGQGAELAGRSHDLLPLLAGRDVPGELFRGEGVALAWSMAGR